MKKIAIFITLAGIITAGCESTDCCMPNVLSANGVQSLDFSEGVGTQYLNLSSSLSWVLENPDQIPDWLLPRPLSGAGSASVKVDVIPNPDYDPRCYTLVFMSANGDRLYINVCQERGDVYPGFMADETPRWENGATVNKNDEITGTFITDGGAYLFGPGDNKYKTGRVTNDEGTEFEIIAFDGAPAVGSLSGAVLYTHSGNTTLYRCDILKVEGTKLWIVFNENAGSTERRIVQ